MTETHEGCIDIGNKMLRGERSAVEAYDEVIDKFSDHPSIKQLEGIRDEHVQSAEDLENLVFKMGGEPDSESGTWGTFVTALQKAVNLLGKDAAIDILIQGEEKGWNDYRSTLDTRDLTPECRNLFETQLFPRIENHLVILTEIAKDNSE